MATPFFDLYTTHIIEILEHYASEYPSIEAIELFDTMLGETSVVFWKKDAKTHHLFNASFPKELVLPPLSFSQEIKKYNQTIGRVTIYFSHPLSLSDKEKAYLKIKSTIKVSNELNYPPYDFVENGQPVGFNIDLINLLAKKIGLDVEYINGYSWNELIDLFQARKIDLIHAVRKTPKREEYALFSKPYRKLKTYYATQVSAPDITDITTLYGKKFAVGKEWAQEEYLLSAYPQIPTVQVDDVEQMVLAVSNGDAYVTAANSDVLRYFILKKGISDVKIAGWFKEMDEGVSYTHHFMARKQEPELISLFDKALDALSLQEIESLERKWFGTPLFDQAEKEGFALSQKEKNYLQNKGSIKMCTDPDWLPFEKIVDGVHTGMAAEILSLVKQRTDLVLELVPTQTWSESIEFAKSRKCDIYSLAMKTKQRLSYMNFTEPYLSFPFVIATRTEEIFVEKLEDVIDKPLAMVKGYAYVEILKNRYPNINLIEVESMLEGLRLVYDKEVYGFIDTLATLAYTIQKEGMVDIKIAGKFDESWELGIGARNDEPLLVDIMQKALQTVSDDEKKAIYNKWYSIKVEQSIDYSIIWKIIAVALLILLGTIYWNRRLQLLNKELERLSVTDKLTGLYNRVKLDERLEYEKERTDRFGQPFSVILLDIDHFKKVNDTYGHQIGDKVLIGIAQVLQNYSRATDIVGRWGGEEFLIICPQTDSVGVLKHAQTLCRIVASQEYPFVGNKTASFGVATFVQGEEIRMVMSRADAALYEAKHKGRNRVEQR